MKGVSPNNISMALNKKIIIILAVVGGIVLILGLLWYYQSQGFIKVFPTAQDRAQKKLLTIDRSKFHPAQGFTNDQFEAELKKLADQKNKILENPGDAQAWFAFGYTKEFLNDHEGAVGVWEKALELQPLNFVTAANLGNAYQYFLKNYPKAEEDYLKALAVRPDYTGAYRGLADLYQFNWKDRQDRLEPLLLEAIQKDSANKKAYYVNLVEFFAGANNLTKAKDYLVQVKSLDPKAARELLDTYPGLKK